MKRIIPLLVAISAAGRIFAADPASPTATNESEITKEEATSAKAIDVAELAKSGGALSGKVVKLKFSTRAVDSRITATGFQGTVLSKGMAFAGVSVGGAKEGADWFSKVSTDLDSRRTYVVIARIKNGTFARILGREIKTDMKGSKVVW